MAENLDTGRAVLDEEAVILYLDVPADKVVHLQCFFELYEGVGLVRTLDIRRSLVSVITTPSLEQECRSILAAIQPKVGWRFTTPSSDAEGARYIGYTRKVI